MNGSSYLPGTHPRATWLRMESARILKRFFFCEQALVIAQGGWIAGTAPLEVKIGLGRHLWEDAMTADALRERVFELRYPSRLVEIADDAAVVSVFQAAADAPASYAFVLALAQVFKPALARVYADYLAHADEIADGPSKRFLNLAIAEKQQQIADLERWCTLVGASDPGGHAAAVAWVQALKERLDQVGGLSIDAPHEAENPVELVGKRPFKLAETPARDARFHLTRYYWPDNVDSSFPYGEGVQLQLRSAVSHLNEAWAVETAGAILQAFAEQLGWEFVHNAARWTYDEARHCWMGYERLMSWGFAPHELPLGTYIYDSARGQDPIYRLGMLSYFETKNIGKKNQRARAFGEYHDRVSQHDMEFDWADETIHAHYGARWLGVLHDQDPENMPSFDDIRALCDKLVAAQVQSATEAERQEIRAIADAMLVKARNLSETRVAGATVANQ